LKRSPPPTTIVQLKIKAQQVDVNARKLWVQKCKATLWVRTKMDDRCEKKVGKALGNFEAARITSGRAQGELLKGTDPDKIDAIGKKFKRKPKAQAPAPAVSTTTAPAPPAKPTPAPAPATLTSAPTSKPKQLSLGDNSDIQVECSVHPSKTRLTTNANALSPDYTLKSIGEHKGFEEHQIIMHGKVIGTIGIALTADPDTGRPIIARSDKMNTPAQNEAFLKCVATYTGTSPPDQPYHDKAPDLTFGDRVPQDQQDKLKVIFTEPHATAKGGGKWPGTAEPNTPSQQDIPTAENTGTSRRTIGIPPPPSPAPRRI